MDCSLPVSSVHGIFQARVLEWGAITCSAAIKVNDSSKQTLVPWDGLKMGSVLYTDEMSCVHALEQ